MHFSVDFNLYTFTAINYSHYYNSFVDSNPIESLNPRVVGETSNTGTTA